MVRACTIIARNYLAHARVLAESFLSCHPGGQFTLLVVDDEDRRHEPIGAPFECLHLSDIGIDQREMWRLAAIYDVTELSTAVKPLLLRYLLTRPGPILYLDPDIRVYRSLEQTTTLAERHGIVLTPHTMVPLPADNRRVDDYHILSSGIFNLGFIGLGQGTDTFIDWWWEKTRRDAVVDHQRMMFTDQRWIDFVPCFFEPFVLKDPTFNVAYWNLHGRELVWRDGHYFVDGRPLAFFHFSGFNPRIPYLLSKHQGDRPRILLSERPVLARICDEYVTSLRAAGFDVETAVPYGWNRLPSAVAFDHRMRRLYRDALKQFEQGKGAEPPIPFAQPDADRFMAWLNEPSGGGVIPRISRYADAVYHDRPDLRRAFPDVNGRDRKQYYRWLRTDGVAQLGIPAALLPPSADGDRHPFCAPREVTAGVNMAGYFRAELGIGEAARLLSRAMEAAGIRFSTVTYDVTSSRKAQEFTERGAGRAPHDVNVICVNADRTPDFARDVGGGFFEGRHNIGYWFWELEDFPAVMHDGFDYVDEVWTATDFVAESVRKIGRKPVYTVPLPVIAPSVPENFTRARLGLPDSFMFLFIFDFFSIIERKNPTGLVEAFRRAFQPEEGPMLVIKTINGDARLNDLERLRASARDRPDVRIIDQYYTAVEKDALLGLCDCYVSLHRSEGFGLTMAEAMALEKPVIATGYSGNLHFMTDENSYLVRYSKAPVGDGCDPYSAASLWADPDLEHAAELMRAVYEDRKGAAAKARRGRDDIASRHSLAVSAAAVRRRLDRLRDEPAGQGSSAAQREATMRREETTPLAAALEHLKNRLTPEATVGGRRSVLGSAALAAQKVLFRVLRPYWWQQRDIQSSLVDAVREVLTVSTDAAAAAHEHSRGLQALWTALNEVRAAVETDRTFLAEVRAHIEAAHNTAAQLQTLQDRLYARPYMSVPERFQYVDANGHQLLGFSSNALTPLGDAAFEDVFRGPEPFIRERMRRYLPLLKKYDKVVDLGCGRGELLDVLGAAGIPVIGVDNDTSMVARCRAKGHTVVEADALTFLRQQADASLPAIVAIEVVEHLPYDTFIAFLEESRQKLTPNGQLIFETVNPHCLEAFKAFYTDLTHQRPIFPEVAVVLCWLAKFDEAFVFYPNGAGNGSTDQRTAGEYAVVASLTAARRE